MQSGHNDFLVGTWNLELGTFSMRYLCCAYAVLFTLFYIYAIFILFSYDAKLVHGAPHCSLSKCFVLF